MSNEECIDSCLNDSACVLLQYNSINDECFQWNTSLHLQFLLLQESGPESHYYVMFKVDLPNDTCPASLDNVNLYFFTDIYYISWIKTYFGWQAGYCRDGWRRLIRSTPTCIKAVPMLFGTSKPEAEAKCNSIGAKLIGVETENEVNWMWEQVKQNASGQKSLYWLDGERVGVERTKFTYSNIMTYNNDKLLSNTSIAELSITTTPNGQIYENCLTIYYEVGVTTLINDVQCSYKGVSGAFCGHGLILN